LHTGAATSHELAARHTPGEALLVAADDDPTGTGRLLTFVYHADCDASGLTILNAADLTAAQVARTHLPRRVPYGFHGTWIPDHAPLHGWIGHRFETSGSLRRGWRSRCRWR